MYKPSANWSHETPFLIDPAVKKQAMLFAPLLIICIVFLLKGEDIMNHFKNSHNRDLLLPQMAQLAAQGKPEAVAWMVLHDGKYGSDTKFLTLKTAAETGNPQSMYLYGLALRSQKNEQGALDYIARAAAEGYPDALLEQSKRNPE
ncbi:hypothetical protein GIW05_01200 [Pseudomonas syringae]|uniref:hypothetical protein n=1 Tax=Pseudomonas syringae TaxID=317 RepID=UPI001F36851E|nr:hypothetical protein [Pseudomonas syringae]MCF5382139.1 hypothetical protein [Pseudomonas syringae]MCF5423528.1 hypothetical protein [Pseudomonas syringae]MCF5455212.1 hypothetical protein [Pseudomonas syringae]MCF5460420.1 hypothetical protein [Pseudomonas syringae]